MRLSIKLNKNIKLVMTKGTCAYSEVIKTMEEAKFIRIATYNISKDNEDLLDELKKTSANIKIITNIPGRFEKGYSNKYAKKNARENIERYINKLHPYKYNLNTEVFFNFENHCKIVMTDKVAYIGSSNYSSESKENFECGVIIKDTNIIKEFNDKCVDRLIKESYPYHNAQYTRILDYIWYAESRILDLEDWYNEWATCIKILHNRMPLGPTEIDASLSSELLKSIVALSENLCNLIFDLEKKYPSEIEEEWIEEKRSICREVVGYFDMDSRLGIYSMYNSKKSTLNSEIPDDIFEYYSCDDDTFKDYPELFEYCPHDIDDILKYYGFDTSEDLPDMFEYDNSSTEEGQIDYDQIKNILKYASYGAELLDKLHKCINSLFTKIIEINNVNEHIDNTSSNI